MSRKKKIITIASILLCVLFSIPILISLANKYDCSLTPGPHYCSIGATNPNFIERIAGAFAESFQVKAGGMLLTLRQDIISNEENTKAVSLAEEIYTEMDLSSQWRDLPSSLGIAYEKVARLSLSPQQYFFYMPTKFSGNVIVFLHGYGGNFKSYLYLLAQVAEKTESVIIAPSYRSGVWDESGQKFIDLVISDSVDKFKLTTGKFSLIGISNGGLIIPDYLKTTKYKFSNVIALSTFLDPDIYVVDKPAFENVNFTYIYGADDKRIGVAESLESLEFLKQSGATVNTVALSGDHLLLFEQRSRVLSELEILLK